MVRVSELFRKFREVYHNYNNTLAVQQATVHQAVKHKKLEKYAVDRLRDTMKIVVNRVREEEGDNDE